MGRGERAKSSVPNTLKFGSYIPMIPVGWRSRAHRTELEITQTLKLPGHRDGGLAQCPGQTVTGEFWVPMRSQQKQS